MNPFAISVMFIGIIYYLIAEGKAIRDNRPFRHHLINWLALYGVTLTAFALAQRR